MSIKLEMANCEQVNLNLLVSLSSGAHNIRKRLDRSATLSLATAQPPVCTCCPSNRRRPKAKEQNESMLYRLLLQALKSSSIDPGFHCDCGFLQWFSPGARDGPALKRSTGRGIRDN